MSARKEIVAAMSLPPPRTPERSPLRALPTVAGVAYALLSWASGPPVSAAPTGGTPLRTGLLDPIEADRTKEYRVKAALIFNFIKYTTWPKAAFDKPSDPIVLLVVGEDPFGEALEKTFEGKTLHGRSIKVERSKELPKELKAHVVFAGTLDAEIIPKLIAATRDKPILLVGERAGFAAEGGYLNFYEEAGKVRFEVNQRRKADTKLELSAELLKLARVVEAKEAVR